MFSPSKCRKSRVFDVIKVSPLHRELPRSVHRQTAVFCRRRSAVHARAHASPQPSSRTLGSGSSPVPYLQYIVRLSLVAVIEPAGRTEPQLMPDQCGIRDFVFLLTSNNINVRFRPQWNLDNVGVEKASHRLQPNIASSSLFAQISKQFVGIKFKIRNVNVGSETPICYGKVAPN